VSFILTRAAGPVATFFVGKQRHMGESFVSFTWPLELLPYMLVIVLGTMDAAVDLLEKCGDIYSNRPHLIMG
jgi:hypothetical protein